MNKKPIALYLVFAFLIAWLLHGWLALNRIGIQTQLGTLVLAISMWAPALAVLISKALVPRPRAMYLSLKPNFKGNMRWYLLAWLLPLGYTMLGGILYYSIFQSHFDIGLGAMRSILEQNQAAAITGRDLRAAFAIQIFFMLTINTILTMLLALGEEIGWRGFLYPALRELASETKAQIICGVIWGLWHAPAIAMGHNYGTAYRGYPWLGIIAMCLPSIGFGVLFSFVTKKTGSIWPAALAHGANNAITGAAGLFISDEGLKHMDSYGTLAFGTILVVPMLLIACLLHVSSEKQSKAA